MTPSQAWVMGAGATIAGLWGALPYFAAIDQILKADVSQVETMLALAYYNVVFIALGALLVLVVCGVNLAFLIGLRQRERGGELTVRSVLGGSCARLLQTVLGESLIPPATASPTPSATATAAAPTPW